MQFTTSQKVLILQNTEENLLLQYSARHKYNMSEYLYHISWAICLLSAFLSIFSSNVIVSILSFGLDVAAIVITYIITKSTSQAGDLRELFDSNTLGYTTKFSASEISSLKELAFKYKTSSAYIKSSTNNGHDNPPGVRDWYEFTTELAIYETQKECLHQNIWWNKKMSFQRILLTSVTGIFSIVLFVISTYLGTGISKATVIGIASTIILKFFDALINNIKYFELSKAIDVLYEHLEKEITELLLIDIQEKINQRRHLTVFELNFIHKQTATKLSELYKSTH